MQIPRPTDYPTLEAWALELVRRLEQQNFATELARRLVQGNGIMLQYDPQAQTITISKVP